MRKPLTLAPEHTVCGRARLGQVLTYRKVRSGLSEPVRGHICRTLTRFRYASLCNVRVKLDRRFLCFLPRILLFFTYFAAPCPSTFASSPSAPIKVEPKSIAREHDPVKITCASIPGFLGEPIEQCRLYAVHNHEFAPIPFQIDEVDSKGLYVLPNGKRPNRDRGKREGRREREGQIDENDEILFMARDLGDRALEPTLPPGLVRNAEIEVVDPLTKGKGWAYLLSFPDPPAPSSVDYVRFAPEEDRIYADFFTLGYSPLNDLVYTDYLSVTPAAGGNGKNLIDRMNIRFTASILLRSLTFSRHEDDFTSEIIAYKDGAVRVMRRVGNHMRLVFGIKSPEVIAYSVYYRNAIESPNTFHLPFDMRTYVKSVEFYGGTDYRSNCAGMTFYTSDAPNGVVVDGRMSDREKELDRSEYEWTVLAGPQGAMMSRLDLSPSFGVVMGKKLHYLDDGSALNPPESEPGLLPYIGYIPTNLLDLKKGTYYYNVHIYFPPNYRPGDEKKFLHILDHPLKVTVSNDCF